MEPTDGTTVVYGALPMSGSDESIPTPWRDHAPDRVLGRGHPVGDFLEAWRWEVLERGDGRLRVSAHLPPQVLNPRGELFGGFTPTYVDLISLFTVHSRVERASLRGRVALSTLSLRVDYLEPVRGPDFVIDSRVEASRGLTDHVVTTFRQGDVVAVLATATLRSSG